MNPSKISPLKNKEFVDMCASEVKTEINFQLKDSGFTKLQRQEFLKEIIAYCCERWGK